MFPLTRFWVPILDPQPNVVVFEKCLETTWGFPYEVWPQTKPPKKLKPRGFLEKAHGPDVGLRVLHRACILRMACRVLQVTFAMLSFAAHGTELTHLMFGWAKS